MAILARGAQPLEARRALPGDAEDVQSRSLETAVHGIVLACLYLPNGNPQPGPTFDYKLRCMERLITHAKGLVALPHPVALMSERMAGVWRDACFPQPGNAAGPRRSC